MQRDPGGLLVTEEFFEPEEGCRNVQNEFEYVVEHTQLLSMHHGLGIQKHINKNVFYIWSS